ncbi:4'-phosphopantetheinyl transferase superfamily protein [Mobilicoccus sp.]|uniref:4'-phosphopantetheinyl transferase family protein n=1 Tax=Mobilicoccus sp. TaxID=2034349 RepID=UPI0028B024E5|nr:4'-phosphopantetheinyl transferase superfamily protein [Mobilicoccus sp.]
MNEPRRVAEVHVYSARPTFAPESVHLLDDDERTSLATLRRPRDHARYVSAHALLRYALAQHTGIPESAQRFHRRCVLCRGPHGKPRLLPPGVEPGEDGTLAADPGTPHVNLSHTDGRIVLALSPHHAVGVDVERWDATSFAGFASVALTSEEARELLEFDVSEREVARAVWWCRKEAVLKATGHGLRVDARHLRVSAPDRPAALLDWTDDDIPRPTVSMADLPVRGRYAAAVAVAGDVELRVHLHEVDTPDAVSVQAVPGGRNHD